jgi:hypothetical protein
MAIAASSRLLMQQIFTRGLSVGRIHYPDVAKSKYDLLSEKASFESKRGLLREGHRT